MVKPVSLSVHKNTLEQRRRKICRRNMKATIQELSQTDCVDGFFIVGWDKDRNYQVGYYDPNRTVGMSSLSNYVGGVAARYIGQLDRKDDD